MLFRSVSENPAEIFKEKKAWVFFVAAFLYITFQLGTNMWLPTYAMQNVDADFKTAGLMLTAFFAPALPMRFLTPLLLRRIPKPTFFTMFGLIAAALMLVVYNIQSIPAMFVLIACVGFAQGSIVVVLIMMCIEAFPERSASATSLVTIASGVSTLTGPLWMGGLAEITGFRLPMIMISCSLAAAALVIFFQNRANKSV